jgi:hypothetical protein
MPCVPGLKAITLARHIKPASTEIAPKAAAMYKIRFSLGPKAGKAIASPAANAGREDSALTNKTASKKANDKKQGATLFFTIFTKALFTGGFSPGD